MIYLRGFASLLSFPGSRTAVRWRESVAEGVFGDGPRQEEVEQVVGAARLGAAAGELEAAERLAVHQGAGDLAVDVEIADAELAARLLDVGRAAGIDAPRERVERSIGGLADEASPVPSDRPSRTRSSVG